MTEIQKEGLFPAHLVAEVVRRIVVAAQPEKIVLFGSVARGEAGAGSDLDFLVVKQCSQRREMTGQIYKKLVGVGVPVDIVVVTPDDIKRYGASPSMVIEPALREGKIVYAA